ncbi:MAG: hypothetical protein M3319_09860 [Actinomycetota bacterium]|nr:hypothetical protein [Actinomycetota bacterium]
MTRETQLATLTTAPPDCQGWSKLRICRVRMFGVRAWLTASVNNAEWRRRERVGLDAMTRVDVLDGLLGLPLGLPVPLYALTTHERQLVSQLPPGVVDQPGDLVIRRAEPVVECFFALVFAPTWSAGLADALKFAPFCARLTVLESRPADETAACLEASYYGVGLAIQARNDHTMLVPPEPLVRRRVTAAGWWFTEETYRQIKATT